MIKGPSRMSGSGRGPYTKVRKWSGDPYKGPNVVEDHPGGPEVVGRPSRRSESG